jgi:predicted phage terminase large subunit-like protein
MPGMRWDWPHTQYIIQHLQALADGEIENLMISVPPQHGKTQLASIGFGAFLLNRDEALRIAITSFSAEPAMRISRMLRRVMREIGSEFFADSNSVEEWELLNGSKVRATGVGGALTSFPVDIGILDDPLKDRLEADSPRVRQNLWEWYTDVWLARNMKRQVLIGTEWHEDGLHGRIRNSAAAHRWTQINLPAIAIEDDPLGRSIGEPLCADRVSLEVLLERRADNPYSFEAMYQGNPTPREGALFKVNRLNYCDASEVPLNLPTKRIWDFAASEEGDYTVGLKMHGPSPSGHYYVSDIVRGRWSVGERDQIILQTTKADGPNVKVNIPQDPGAAGVAQVQAIVQLLSGYFVEKERETGSKEMRAEPVASQVEHGNIVLVRGPWNAAFVEELRTFPIGKNDDQVDPFARGFNNMARKRTLQVYM